MPAKSRNGDDGDDHDGTRLNILSSNIGFFNSCFNCNYGFLRQDGSLGATRICALLQYAYSAAVAMLFDVFHQNIFNKKTQEGQSLMAVTDHRSCSINGCHDIIHLSLPIAGSNKDEDRPKNICS